MGTPSHSGDTPPKHPRHLAGGVHGAQFHGRPLWGLLPSLDELPRPDDLPELDELLEGMDCDMNPRSSMMNSLVPDPEHVIDLFDELLQGLDGVEGEDWD
jgi:hypothetical protein